MSISDQELLLLIDDLARSMPSRAQLQENSQEALAWLGATHAALMRWDVIRGANSFELAEAQLSHAQPTSLSAYRRIGTLLYSAKADIGLRLGGPRSVSIGAGKIFDYYDSVRKIVELASADIFFIDPYLEAEFVSKYLVHVKPPAAVRLLTSEKKLASLLSALAAFSQQTPLVAQVRSDPGLHDRFVLVDGREGYQSGASFKDGGKNAPTTLMQIFDTFSSTQKTYEDIWAKAKVEKAF